MSIRNLLVLNHHCTVHDISMRQLALLTVLTDGMIRPSDLAKRLYITPSAMTGQIDSLEHKGYIERKLLADRRATAIQITDSGRHLIHQAELLTGQVAA
jgi:DNA-binding MarR family transcriptional regulator